jgi:hypothetical protein
MDRSEVIQYLVDKKKYNRYLEIGVFNGEVFFKIKAPKKYAVDPVFRFVRETKYKMMFKNSSNVNAKYFTKTSDDFFKEDAPALFGKKKIDICFIDGMHEFDFVLRDTINTLDYLDEDGVIILHDCNPLTAEAEVSYEEWVKRGFTGEWNGDVWKIIVYLKSKRDDINVFTLDTDQGLGIITKGIPQAKLNFTEEQIRQFTFKDLDANRKEWLSLNPENYLLEYFS